MTMLYDSNGFIWEFYDGTTPLLDTANYTVADIDFDFGVLVDPVYALPNYRYVDGAVHEVTDPQEYMIDSDIWLSYLSKLDDHVQFLLKTKTDEEMRTIYATSPPYVQTAIYYGIELKWANYISQHRTNLGFEMVLRTVTEYLYIKEVEKREPTADEWAGIVKMLTKLHEHSATVEFPIKEDGWYHGFVESMLQDSDYARYQCIPQRYYITGRT